MDIPSKKFHASKNTHEIEETLWESLLCMEPKSQQYKSLLAPIAAAIQHYKHTISKPKPGSDDTSLLVDGLEVTRPQLQNSTSATETQPRVIELDFNDRNSISATELDLSYRTQPRLQKLDLHYKNGFDYKNNFGYRNSSSYKNAAHKMKLK